MRGAYLECHSGIAGDMFVGALLDAGLDFERLHRAIRALPLTGYALHYDRVRRSHFDAGFFRVEVHDDQPARHYATIREMVEQWSEESAVRQRALKIFDALAEAESSVHGTPIERVHFHEVGAVDSIVDICAAAWGLENLKIERIVSSPINVGSGSVDTQHGQLSVPAPATLNLLTGVPIYSEGEAVELATPTGAAIVRTQVNRFGALPAMIPEQIGLGAGGRELRRANVVRLTIGELQEQRRSSWEEDEIAVLETHLDDVTGETLGFVTQSLLEAGALDVTHAPVTMKKSRPGIRLTVIAPNTLAEALAEDLARETGTFGIRIRRESRLKLTRSFETVETRFGQIRIKVGRLANSVVVVAPEYDDCSEAAIRHDVPLRQVQNTAREIYVAMRRDPR